MLIGITGKAGSGKDTVANALVGSKGFRKLAFADTLKDMMCAMLGVTREKLEDRDFKESTHPLLGGKTVRLAMQTLGTEWGRETFGTDVWVNITGQRILDLRNPDKAADFEKGIVVSDVRFDSEAKAIKSLGGIVIEISRFGIEQVEAHSSENGVSRELVDFVFPNNWETVEEAQIAFLETVKYATRGFHG